MLDQASLWVRRLRVWLVVIDYDFNLNFKLWNLQFDPESEGIESLSSFGCKFATQTPSLPRIWGSGNSRRAFSLENVTFQMTCNHRPTIQWIVSTSQDRLSTSTSLSFSFRLKLDHQFAIKNVSTSSSYQAVWLKLRVRSQLVPSETFLERQFSELKLSSWKDTVEELSPATPRSYPQFGFQFKTLQ